MNCLSGKVKSSFNDTILYIGILNDFDNWLVLQDIMQNPYIYIWDFLKKNFLEISWIFWREKKTLIDGSWLTFLLIIINISIVSNFFKLKNGSLSFLYDLYGWKHTYEMLKSHLKTSNRKISS